MLIYRGCIMDDEGDTRFLAYHITETGAYNSLIWYGKGEFDEQIPALTSKEWLTNPDVDEKRIPDFPYGGWVTAIDSFNVIED